MQPRSLIVATFIAIATSACHGGSSPASPTVIVDPGETIVVIRADGTPVDKLPFDRRAAKLEQATHQLAAIAGHPIGFQIEASLITEERSGFEERLTRSIEVVAQEFGSLKQRRPEAFAWSAQMLHWIECRYDATARRPTRQLDMQRGVLKLTIPPETWELIERGAVYQELDKAYDRYLESRWSSVEPDAVAPAERMQYFEYLTDVGTAWRRAEPLRTPDSFARDTRGEVLRKVVRLHDLMGEGAGRTEVRKWILEAGRHFSDAYLHEPALVQSAAPGSSFHRAEAAWVQWLNGNLARLDDEQRLQLARVVFVRQFNPSEHVRKFAPFAFPGFDTLGFAMGVADEWVRAGHPSVDADPSKRAELYEHVVCPYERDERGNFSRARRCNHDLYDLAIDTQGGSARLLRFLLDKHDARLTDAAFVSVLQVGSAQDVMDFWRGVEGQEETWRRATMILAEHGENKAPALMIDESARLWKKHPGRRGTVLYLLANLDPYGHGNVPWERFADSFGAPISSAEFASFLDQSFRAFSMQHIVWKALGQDWDRAGAIVPRLDAWMDHPRLRDANFQDPYMSLRGLVQRLCEEGRAGEVSRVGQFLRDRVRRHPSEERGFHELIDETAQPKCEKSRR